VVITGTLSEGLAALTHKIKESTLTTSNYEFGAQLIEKSKDAAVNLALSIGSAGTELVGGLAELAYSGWSMFTSKIESVCTAPEESASTAPILASAPISDEEQFCSEIEIIVLFKDTFEFSVNIPGYTGPFNKELIFFGLGTITENDVESPPTYPSVLAASTTTTFDPLNDDVLLLFFSETLSAGTYTLDETWITDGGSVDISFTSSEILEDISAGYKWPVSFSQIGGTLELEYYGASYGDRLKGSFSVTVQGDKTTCLNTECEDEGTDYIIETITGTITGTFDGYIKEDTTASSSAISATSSMIRK
jgi:hypothetical protein